MRYKRYIAFFITILVLELIPVLTAAQECDNICYKFSQTDSSYSFTGSFITNADPKCLLDICFNIEHLQKLAPDAKEVRLVNEEENHNQVSYTYQRYIYFENISLWNRRLFPQEQKVTFRLLSSINNKSIMPVMVSSDGYYQIKNYKNYNVVEYYQVCILKESALSKLYLKSAKSEAIDFLVRFSDYANSICGNSANK